MPESVIRQGRVEPDTWHRVDRDPAPGASADWPAGDLLVPLALWRERREALLARPFRTGVWLAPEDDPALLAPDLGSLDLVAVHFPKFSEGRGYSAAALLRQRHGYRGELRAFGDIGRDNLFYLARVGFDAFALRPGTDLARALAGLEDFSVRYQASSDRSPPLFRARMEARGG